MPLMRSLYKDRYVCVNAPTYCPNYDSFPLGAYSVQGVQVNHEVPSATTFQVVNSFPAFSGRTKALEWSADTTISGNSTPSVWINHWIGYDYGNFQAECWFWGGFISVFTGTDFGLQFYPQGESFDPSAYLQLIVSPFSATTQQINWFWQGGGSNGASVNVTNLPWQNWYKLTVIKNGTTVTVQIRDVALTLLYNDSNTWTNAPNICLWPAIRGTILSSPAGPQTQKVYALDFCMTAL